MYFECDSNGKIMVCAETAVKDGMAMIEPPEDFIPEEMHKWLVVDGAIVRNADYVEPEAKQTTDERIAELEEELRAAKILLGVE
jgi:hypothetical protein